MPKQLGWKRFDHISIVVPDAAEAVTFYMKLFGLRLNRWATSEEEGYRAALLDMPNDQGQFEILEPAGVDSFLRTFLQERGPGVHHITVEVDDVEKAAAYLREEMGIEPHRGVWSDGDWKQTFIHPRDSGGVLYQLFEWAPNRRPSGSADS